MIQTTVMKGDSEVVHYDCPGVPLYIRTAHLSSYPDGRALCHWHDDLEWIHILEGTMNYYINGQRITLRAGDSLMVTPRQMHYGYSVRREDDCHFICILLHPDLITQNRSLSQKYLQPLLEDCPADYLHVSSGTTDGNESANILKTAAALHSEQAPGWELKVIGLLICLFADTLPLLTPKHPSASTEEAGDLLRRSSDSITEIALACGFHHMSYFSELFSKTYGCTPREYRAGLKGDATPPAF